MATIIRVRRPTTVWSARFPAPPNSPLPSAVSAAAATTVPAAAALATVCLSTNNQQQQQQQQPISSFKPKKKMKGKRETPERHFLALNLLVQHQKVIRFFKLCVNMNMNNI